MTDDWCRDDDQLLAELGEAILAAHKVPTGFVDLGKAAFSWRNLDAELAILTDDSANGVTDAALMAGTRAEVAALRALTFVAGRLTIEVEITDAALRGQVVPPVSGEIELSGRDGTVRTVPVDEVGWFVIRPTPAGLFRLRIPAADGGAVLTQWFTV